MNPSFDSLDLVDHAAVEVLGSPQRRTTRERLPDVAGEFYQVSPSGGREIVVRGVLASSAQATAELAGADLRTKVRLRQDRIGRVGTYCGTDGHAYASSCLLSFRQLGPIQVAPSGSGLQALGRVEARIEAQP